MTATASTTTYPTPRPAVKGRLLAAGFIAGAAAVGAVTVATQLGSSDATIDPPPSAVSVLAFTDVVRPGARRVGGSGTPLTVIAPEGPSSRFAEHCLDAYDDQSFYSQASSSSGPRPVTAVRSFDASAAVITVYSSGPWAVDSALVDHHPVAPAVGYLVRHGRLRVAISGDTAACDGMRRLADGADVLVHEAVLGGAVRPALLEWNASASAVGELARTAGVGRLVLTHAIPPPKSDADRQRDIDDVRAGGYAGPVLVASDLDRLELSDAHA